MSARPKRRRGITAVAVAVLAVSGLSALGTQAATAATLSGTMVLQNVTKPGGGVWLPGPVGTPGHYWMPDGVLGFCRVDPAPGATPPFATSRCTGTAKAGSQAVYDASAKKVYVADAATKSVNIVRYDYDQNNENVINPKIIAVNNVTAVGGGSGGGRPASVALSPDGSKLYVGYLKSGDIMVVANPAAATPGAVSRAGVTSDGRGDQGFALFTRTDGAGVKHDDLYVAETGGAGLSVIGDIDGTGGRPACGAGATPCNASTVTNSTGQVVSFFPGGLVGDGTLLYVGDAPANQPGSVLRFNPATGKQDVFSTDITPSYTPVFDGVTRTKYSGITGIGLGANGDLYVGDDPTVALATPPANSGHLWKIAAAATQPSISSITPAAGDIAGGTAVTVTGKNLVNAVAGVSTVSFGSKAGAAVTCTADGLTCKATSPAVTGAGVLDVRVTDGDGQTSPVVAADQFTYTVSATPPPPNSPVITKVTPATGLAAGGTSVKIDGTALVNPDGTATISFGANTASGVSCVNATSCTAVSPAGTDGTTVDVQVTTTVGSSPAGAADRFSYVTPVGTISAYGITAPKGGTTFLPGALGGHWWISDHSNGLCRLDPVPKTTLNAINVAVCDPGFTIGSPGQIAYDPKAQLDGTHWVYVPDNAVRSPGVWRLTFDPTTETLSSPVAMAPGLLDNLKTNSLALSAKGDALFVGDLVDGGIRRINGADGDPRAQTVDVIANTQAQRVGAASRGINGTMAMIGNRLFLPENNAATYVDVSAACAAVGTVTPCATTTVDFQPTPAPIFVSGVGTDQAHGFVYISSSPGGANATIWRFDASTITTETPGGTAGIIYATEGNVPAASSPNATVYCSLTCTRPADPTLTPGGTTGFFFAQGVSVDPTTSKIYITEDVSAGNRSGRGHIWELPFVQ
jgi:IPT/TIG domain